MTEASEPVAAMAADTNLLTQAEAGKPGIRCYRWTALCVTLGRHQQALDILVEPGQTDFANRPTGGGAVLHGHDITLTAAIPISGQPKVRELYTGLATLAIEYLAHHGVVAELATTGTRRTSIGYCFEQVAATDLIDASTGLKVCGCALRVTRRAALLQTSIPFRESEVDPGTVIKGAKRIGAPNWHPDDLLDPSLLPSWQRLI